MIYYQIFNHKDEQQRPMRCPTYYICKQGQQPKQVDSHGYSYIYCRKMLQELGQVMGLDLPQSDLEDRL
jgi:hypothetical protein